MNVLRTLCFTALLALTPITYADGDSANTPSLDQLMGDMMNNIDMSLLLRIQQAMIDNIDTIGPYGEEYIACLKAEGALNSQQGNDLKSLIEQAQKNGAACQFILESMLGKLDFDISQDELEQGLSPEYQKLLEQGLNKGI